MRAVKWDEKLIYKTLIIDSEHDPVNLPFIMNTDNTFAVGTTPVVDLGRSFVLDSVKHERVYYFDIEYNAETKEFIVGPVRVPYYRFVGAIDIIVRFASITPRFKNYKTVMRELEFYVAERDTIPSVVIVDRHSGYIAVVVGLFVEES